MAKESDDFLLEQRVRFGELFDLYASLLTEKQRKSCELMLRDDLSLAELGEELGMTRQGAYDLVRRSREYLDEIEGSLGFSALKERMDALAGLLARNREVLPAEFFERASALLSAEVKSTNV